MRFDEYVKVAVRRPIKLIKIDVEGADYRVLLGMREILLTQRPRLIIEAQDWSLARFGHSLSQIFDLLEGFDYSAFDLDGCSLGDVEEARLSLRSRWVKNLLFEAP